MRDSISHAKERTGCLGTLFRLFLGKTGEGAVTYPYRVRDDFLSAAELSLYHVLTTVVGTQAVVLAKVRLADLFLVQRPHENLPAFNRIARRHVDFLLCAPKTMQPLLGIELDDASHARKDRAQRDDFVNRAFAAASLPLLRIPAQRSYHTRELAGKITPFLEGSTSLAPTPDIAAAHTPPLCPKCGVHMVIRTGTRGAHQGEEFYGCPNYPRCHSILPLASSR